MNDITGLISVPLNQQCNISIVFSNEAGSSEPFILAFGKYVCVYITCSVVTLTDAYHSSPNDTNITTITIQTSPTTIPVSTSFNISTG